jgi:hypothetical protein
MKLPQMELLLDEKGANLPSPKLGIMAEYTYGKA